jgi:hypothetical protein
MVGQCRYSGGPVPSSLPCCTHGGSTTAVLFAVAAVQYSGTILQVQLHGTGFLLGSGVPEFYQNQGNVQRTKTGTRKYRRSTNSSIIYAGADRAVHVRHGRSMAVETRL